MVGLKTFWITICALFMLAACVPQSKQTECRSNEAFNASLRTCVPVVGGPSSFININSFAPVSSITKYKNDVTTMTFEVTISNPYNQSYSIAWERVFNGTTTAMCSNALSCSFPASLLGTVLGEVGTHVLIAKVKDGNGTTVDSHNFEIRIVDLPKPVINTASLTPASYAPGPYFPTDPRIAFTFQIKNNNAVISALDNYRTVWSVQKNGATVYTESDSFTSFGPTSTNTAYLGASPTPYFNPATLGVGSYIVRATVQNDVPGEVVAEQQWSVIIKQPDLANVTNISAPAPGITITAHNGIAYDDFPGPPAESWYYGASRTQPDFCVTIDDRDGTYPGDGQSIQVRWYLDSTGGDICTKQTLDTPGSQTICLVDANPCMGTGLAFDTSLLNFNNTSPSVQQNHLVSARLFDEATSLEFERSDVVPSNGSYPVEWKVLVKPVNTAPQLGFGTFQPSGCTSSGAFTRSNCLVNQGTDFTLSFTVSDDFYSPITQANKFQWNLNLKYNGTDMVTTDAAINTNCSKTFAGAPAPAANVTGYSQVAPTLNQWTCRVAVPHHISTGPLDPSSGSFQAVLTMQDLDSPVGGTSQASQSLTWNLVVTETNSPSLTLNPQTLLLADSNISQGAVVYDPTNPASFATETNTINFMMNVSEPQGDNLKYKISLCTDNTSTCATSNIITSPAFIDFVRSIQVDPDMNPVLISFPYTIPQNLLIGMHSSPIDVDTVTSRRVYFKVEVQDAPSVPLTSVTSDTEIFSVQVRNFNPAPVIDTSSAVPAVGSNTEVQSGFQFTINPGTITDASDNAAEKNLQYQWYSRIGAGAWTAVTAAPQTTPILRYTPGNTTSVVELKLCVGDGTAANTTASTGNCTLTWSVTPTPSRFDLTATGSGSLQNEMAVWYDEFNTVPNTQVIYSAYVDENEDIFVEKTIKDTNGDIILSTQTIQFEALPSGTTSTVTNLSVTGSANSVYVAYIASSSSAPATMVPRIRRIDTTFDLTAPAQAKSGMAHPAPFGFDYDGIGLIAGNLACSNAAACTTSVDDGIGGFASISFVDRLTNGDTVTINGEVFTADATPTGTNEVCDSSACATVNSTAQNIRDKINNSTLASLHGIVARANGGVVELYSSYSFDYLDFDGTIAGVPGLIVKSGGLGRIFISGGRWHLPMINSSLGGTDQNNITVLSGSTDVHMRNAGLALNTNDNLLDMGVVAAFDNKLNQAGQMVVARISGDTSDAGALTLFRYTLTGSDWDLTDVTGGVANDRNEQDIMGAYSFEYVKLAADQVTNPYYYVIAKEKSISGGEWHMGRYDKDLLSTYTAPEYFLTARASTADATDDVILDAGNVYPNTDSLIQFPDIVSVPGFSEARIFFHSIGTGVTSFPRLARWKSDDTLACGTCFSLNGNLEHQGTAKIGVSQIANNVALGTVGASAGENTNDMVFVLMSSDLAANDIFKPQLLFVNIEAEAIQSDSVDGSGKFQPPFILD